MKEPSRFESTYLKVYVTLNEYNFEILNCIITERLLGTHTFILVFKLCNNV